MTIRNYSMFWRIGGLFVWINSISLKHVACTTHGKQFIWLTRVDLPVGGDCRHWRRRDRCDGDRYKYNDVCQNYKQKGKIEGIPEAYM